MAKVDLSEFFKYSRPKRKPCAVNFVFGLLNAEEQTQLVAALDQDQGIITNAAVQQWLAARKHDVTVAAVVSHRKRMCNCDG